MSNEITRHSEHEEIEWLLPFYVTGRLDRGDTDRIFDHISRYPNIMRHLPLIHDERAGAIAANEAFAARPTGKFEALAAALAVPPARTAVRDARLLDRIKRFFELPALNPRIWIGTAATVVVVQSFAIGTLVLTQYSPAFETASGAREVTPPGATAVVRFTDGATTSAVTDVLAGLGMAIVDGPRSGGLFTVRLGPRQMNEADRDRAIAGLKAHGDVIAFVTRLP